MRSEEMTAGPIPTSVSISVPTRIDVTSAIKPNASGANKRVKTKLDPKRITCVATLSADVHIDADSTNFRNP